ncbi:hypothetical protein Tco_1088708, partial [Tanacetum coccineum]
MLVSGTICLRICLHFTSPIFRSGGIGYVVVVVTVMVVSDKKVEGGEQNIESLFSFNTIIQQQQVSNLNDGNDNDELFDLSGQEDNEKKQEEENRLLDEEAKSLSDVLNGVVSGHTTLLNSNASGWSLGENASEAQEWIVEFDNAHWEAVGDAL